MVAATTITHVLTPGGTFEAMGVSRTAIEVFRDESDRADESDPLASAPAGMAGGNLAPAGDGWDD
jgi:hypothetical protein